VAEYLHPGVFVEEKPSGAKPIEAASTSTACFTGTAGRGRPSFPTFVSSWFQFKNAFGDLDKNHDLPLSVYQFFQNGGSRAYILRVVASDAAAAADAASNAVGAAVAALPATASSDDIDKATAQATAAATTNSNSKAAAAAQAIAAAKASPKDPTLAAAAELAITAAAEAAVLTLTPDGGGSQLVRIQAAGEGLWGNDIKVSISETKADVATQAALKAAGSTATVPIHFDLQIAVDGQAVERWTTLDGTEDGDKFYAAIINRSSSYIKILPDAHGEFAQGKVNFPSTAPPPAAAAPATAAGTGAPAAPSGTAATGTAASGTAASGTAASGTAASGAAASGAAASGAAASGAAGTSASAAAAAQPAAAAAAAPGGPPAPQSFNIALTGGTDGKADPVAADFGEALSTLDRITDISLLAVPGVDAATAVEASAYVSQRAAKPGVGGDMFYIMDPPIGDQWMFGPRDPRDSATQIATITNFCQTFPNKDTYTGLYFPWIEVPDPYSKVSGATRFVPPSGMIAGLFARTDNARGVWKAPAGTEATVLGAVGVAAQVSDQDQDTLNPIGVNCIRQFPASGIVCWGARTLGTLSNPEYRYVPVRRTANFLKVSLYRGTQWVVFEPNDEPLWSSIRFNLTAFMSSLFRAGAFQGTKPEEAFFVKCDKDNNPQATIDEGQVHILVGFAPLKPAEFVIITLQQLIQQ
jgi:phage tail sheath protein FI